MASWSLSPFNTESRNYNENFVDQLNFLEGQNNMIGRDQGTGLLRYGLDSVLSGKNVISGFGTNDYEEALNNYLTKMRSYKNQTEHQQNQIKKAELELQQLLNQQKKDNASKSTYTGPITYDFDEGAHRRAGGNRPDKPGGHTDPGKDSYGPHKAAGGLATMFTRRR